MRSLDSRGCCVRFLREDTRCAGARWLRCALSPLGLAYGAAMRLRRAAYQEGIVTSYDLGVPVISVGNLSAGGTGKTPMVEYVVRRLAQMGRHPAILSRGYHAHELTPEQARNDEALVLERRLPGVPHYTNPNRVASGRRAVAEGADCIVLDDGFQHLRVRRNLDLVLVDALKPLCGRRVLPAGDLREPVSALQRAGAIVLTRADLLDPKTLAERRAEIKALAPGVPVVEAAHRATGLVDLHGEGAVLVRRLFSARRSSGATKSGSLGKGGCLAPTAANGATGSPDSLAGKRVMLFCGIGNPQGFLATVQGLKADVVATQFLPDHYHYGPADLDRLATLFEDSGAEEALTTEKDAVKLAAFMDEPHSCRGKACLAPTLANTEFLRRVRVLRIEMAILSGEETLDDLLKGAVA